MNCAERCDATQFGLVDAIFRSRLLPFQIGYDAGDANLCRAAFGVALVKQRIDTIARDKHRLIAATFQDQVCRAPNAQILHRRCHYCILTVSAPRGAIGDGRTESK